MLDQIKTSSPMGNDHSAESQHNVGDTIIYNAPQQITLNLKQGPGINYKK